MNTPEKPEVAAPKPITNGEVMPFAKPRCRSCAGKGEITIVKSKEAVERKGDKHYQPQPITADTPTVVTTRICGCALQRFMKAHRGKLCVRSDQALCWMVAP